MAASNAGSRFSGQAQKIALLWSPIASAVWSPPLVMLVVVLVLGQVTVMGATPTVARELAMIATNLAGTAPWQAFSVLAAGAVILIRHRLGARD